jgi:transcriptional regulator GlxA family with amidase domain
MSEQLIDISVQGRVMVAEAISFLKESRMRKSQSRRAHAPAATGGRSRATPYEPLEVEAIEDPVIAAVLRGVRETVGRPVTGTALRALSHMSRRRLEQRFRSTMGCSPMQVIRRVNLERAATMLDATSLSVKEIAKHCCFGSGVHLSVAFKKHFGISPSQFRDQSRSASVVKSHNGRPPRRAG